MAEKIISVKEGKVVEKDGKFWVELTDQEDKTHRIFRSIQNNEGTWLHLDKEVDMLKYRIEDVKDITGLALKLTKEKKGTFWNVIGVEEVKDVFEQKAMAKVQATSIDDREGSIERQVAIKEIGECWRADKMKDNEPEVFAYRAWILDKLNGYMKGAKDAKETKEVSDKETVSGHPRVDDSGGGVKTAEEPIDLAWLKESLKTLDWHNKDVISFLCETFSIEPKPSLTETIRQLTKGQAGLFINEINARLIGKPIGVPPEDISY